MATRALEIRTKAPKDVQDITEQVQARLGAVREGLAVVFVRHTTCALATGEYMEGTGEDLLEVMQKLIPKIDFRHGHDPSHAPDHMAASILGASVTVPIVDGRLALGTWQRVLLLEFNGPRERQLLVQAWGENA